MEENENKKFHRSKRPKIKVKENINNKDYISVTEENSDSDNRRNFKSNKDFKTNEEKEEEESKRLGQNKRSQKKSLNEFKKKMKNLILKINSDFHRLKYIIKKWAYITFNQKNKNMDEDEEEEEEEIEKEENVRENVEVFKMKKVKRFQDDNDDKKDNLDGEEEEEEEEEEEDKFNLMNDLNMNNLEEIEERPPNEEESAMTSVVSKARYPKNQLNVALRKIIKYKNKFYSYFTKWKKVTSSPEIMIILKLQKKLKTLITKLDGKRNLLKLAMAFKDWKMKTEQIKSGEKKNKKKKRIIIYKKKNGEMEIKENIEDCKDLNLKDEDDITIKKDGTKIKKIKKKIIKKKITTSKAKSTKKASTNINNENSNNTTINFTPIKDDNYISQDNLININKKESEKSETNISNTTSDIKTDNTKNESEESGAKRKKIVKKVKKIVKKVKKVKKDNDVSDNEEKSKGIDKKHHHISKTESGDLPQMFISSDQLNILKPYLVEKNNEIVNGNGKDDLNGISYTKKTRIKFKTKKISREDINNKSFDMLLEKGNDFKINNSTNVLFQSYNLNTDIIDDDKSKDKSFSIEDKDGKKKKKIIKKKIKKSKIKDLKDKKENNNEINDNKDINNINNVNFQDIRSIEFTPIKPTEKNEDKSNNDDSSQKKFTPSKVQFKTDDEDSQKKKDPDFYHNYGKDSNLDLRAIDALDLVDFSEDTSEDDAKKVKKKKKTNKIKKNGDNISKDEINPDIANIEITQDEDSDEKKKFNKKKKKKNGKEFTKEEKVLIKIYKRAFHLLRRAIRSFKKRKKGKNEFNDNILLDKHFLKWKKIFMNKDEENNIDRNEDNKNDGFILNDKKLGEEIIKNNIDLDLDNKGENNDTELIKIENKNKIEENLRYKNDSENQDSSNNNEEALAEADDAKNNKKDNEDINNEKENNESKKNNLLFKLYELVKTNYKTQNGTIDIIKSTDEKIFDKIELEKYVNLVEENNKRIYAYQIFCLFTNYNENPHYCMKNNNPKRFYFNCWNKNINK